jgi:hypothetical protein
MTYPLLRLPDCASRSSRTAVTMSPASSWSSAPELRRPVFAEYAIHSGGDQRCDLCLAIDHMVIMHL